MSRSAAFPETDGVLIVVPARGGSMRVPRKNIKPLNGVPLLAYTLVAARTADIGAPLVVSTEDEEIAEVAQIWGGTAIRRPASLASNSASTEGVLLHALDEQEKARQAPFAWVMTLPPTSPFRGAAAIRRFAALTRQGMEVDCLMSVTENRGDFWRMDPDGRMRRLFPDAPRRQQDREPLYEENSAIYVTRVTALRRTGSILGSSVAGVPLSNLEAFDINTPHDFDVAEALIASTPSLAIPLR